MTNEFFSQRIGKLSSGGCTQRTYVGPAQEDRITIDDLEEEIKFHSAPDWEDDNDSELD